jgi:ATP-dependent DNA helicase RecG
MPCVSGNTLISIFDDRIEFVTIGGLVQGISRDGMLLGVSILRNKILSPNIETTDNAFKITLFNKLYEAGNPSRISKT